jgi:site-specific recombinase XerD
MHPYQDLIEFVERAKRSRKYPENTAYALVTALKLYENELNDEEKASFEKVRDNFEAITQSVFSKNQSRFTASSLATYKSRVVKVLSDYGRYSDPVKMNNWNPRVVARIPKQKQSLPSREAEKNDGEQKEDLQLQASSNLHRINIALRDGVQAYVVLPLDITKTEAERVKKFIDAVVE